MLNDLHCKSHINISSKLLSGALKDSYDKCWMCCGIGRYIEYVDILLQIYIYEVVYSLGMAHMAQVCVSVSFQIYV